MQKQEWKPTALQMIALEYAAGLHDCFPTVGVATRLEKRGLLVWTGPVRIHGKPHRDTIPGERGWKLTNAGKAILGETKMVTETCPKCGAVYEVKHISLIQRDIDTAECDDCGTELMRWNGAEMWMYKKIKDGNPPKKESEMP